jgi:hypothetical protein
MAQAERDGAGRILDLSWRPRNEAELRAMKEAGAEILECYRVLRKVGANVVGEVLKTGDGFFEWDHYPPGDVFDEETHSQYYYHAHRGAAGEHGHFHTFLREGGYLQGARPPGDRSAASANALSHLVAISMDAFGYPTHLFTTNRWVTGEVFFPASDVTAMVDRFAIDHASPSWPSNRWITAMLRLFRPQIELLLHERDAAIERHRAVCDGDPLEDRGLEIASIMEISVERQIALLEQGWARA